MCYSVAWQVVKNTCLEDGNLLIFDQTDVQLHAHTVAQLTSDGIYSLPGYPAGLDGTLHRIPPLELRLARDSHTQGWGGFLRLDVTPLIWAPTWPEDDAESFVESVCPIANLLKEGVIDRHVTLLPLLDGLSMPAALEPLMTMVNTPLLSMQQASRSAGHRVDCSMCVKRAIVCNLHACRSDMRATAQAVLSHILPNSASPQQGLTEVRFMFPSDQSLVASNIHSVLKRCASNGYASSILTRSSSTLLQTLTAIQRTDVLVSPHSPVLIFGFYLKKLAAIIELRRRVPAAFAALQVDVDSMLQWFEHRFRKEHISRFFVVPLADYEASDLVSQHACENVKIKLACKEGSLIKISHHTFGRQGLTICPPTDQHDMRQTNCTRSNSTILQRLCDLKQSCQVMAAAVDFGDPCYRTSKYLHVTYRCLSFLEAAGCHGEKLRLNCREGSQISDLHFSVGSATQCKSMDARLPQCDPQRKAAALIRLEKHLIVSCTGKQECVLKEDTANAHGRCLDHTQQLKVLYTCSDLSRRPALQELLETGHHRVWAAHEQVNPKYR